MAVGPTEALNSGVLQFTASQIRISTRIAHIVQQMVEGYHQATVNPDSAIAPAGQGRAIATEGIGNQIDYQA